MMGKFLLLLILTLSSLLTTCFAQERRSIDSLLNKLKNIEASKMELGRNFKPLMDTSKANTLYEIVKIIWGIYPDSAKDYAQQCLSISERIDYKKGVGNAYNGIGLIYMAKQNYPLALENYQKALRTRTMIGDKVGMAWTYNNMGMLYGNESAPAEAIKWHTKSLKLKQEIGDKVGAASQYGKIGHLYVGLGKIPEALNNYLHALKIGEENGDKKQISVSYSDIGNVYSIQGNYPVALSYYLNELKIAIQIRDKLEIATADENMGRISYKQGNDTGAIRYMLAALKSNEELYSLEGIAGIHYYLGLVYLAMGNYSGALTYADSSLKDCQNLGSQIGIALIYIEIGSIYEKQGRLQDALNSVTKGLSLALENGDKNGITDAYLKLAGINAEIHNYKTAYDYGVLYRETYDSIHNSENDNKTTQLVASYEFEKREDSISAEQEKTNIIRTAESNRKSIITISSVVISILTLLMAILLLNRLQIKRKKDKIIFEKESDLFLLERQRMEDELAKANITLDEYVTIMVGKNELLEKFKVDVENLKNLKAKEIDENRIERLELLNKTTILTEADWNKFKELFEQVYKGFFIRLKEKQPELTQAEIRLVCLTKLKLDTKQMGGILGVSFDTIKKSRHRLRKKLSLSEEVTLDNIADSI